MITPSENIKAVIVYSDGLKESAGRIQRLAAEGVKIYLVNKESQDISKILSELGLNRGLFESLVFDAQGKSSAQIRSQIISTLRREKIALKDVDIYAKSEEDIASWRDILVDKLIKIIDSENFQILTDLSKIYEEHKKASNIVGTQA